ncbi:MAG: hypothetical protein WCF16_07140 [Alphaproteobacteria bacterium]
MLRKLSAMLAAIGLVLALGGTAVAGEFDGAWKVQDSAGHPFKIVLKTDGTASSTHKVKMKGTWQEVNGAAEITWNTGWKTKIAKEGDKYVKTAYKPGTSFSDPPANTSPAVKGKSKKKKM